VASSMVTQAGRQEEEEAIFNHCKNDLKMHKRRLGTRRASCCCLVCAFMRIVIGANHFVRRAPGAVSALRIRGTWACGSAL